MIITAKGQLTQAILGALIPDVGLTASEIADTIGHDRATVSGILARLAKHSRVERHASIDTEDDRWFYYKAGQ